MYWQLAFLHRLHGLWHFPWSLKARNTPCNAFHRKWCLLCVSHLIQNYRLLCRMLPVVNNFSPTEWSPRTPVQRHLVQSLNIWHRYNLGSLIPRLKDIQSHWSNDQLYLWLMNSMKIIVITISIWNIRRYNHTLKHFLPFESIATRLGYLLRSGKRQQE